MGGKNKKQSHKNTSAGGLRKSTVAIVLFLCLALVYISFASYFETHFLPKTVLNGQDISFKTVQEVEETISKKVADYKLEVTDSSGEKGVITGKDIGLTYDPEKTLVHLMKTQGNTKWLLKINHVKTHKMAVDVSFSRDRLDETIKKMDIVKDNAEKAVSAKIVLQEGKFVIIPESPGKEINVQVFEEAAEKAISDLSGHLNLLEAGCYAKPRYTKDAPEVLKACQEMNAYLNMVITYKVAPKQVQIDGSQIKDWISADDNFKIHINEEKILEYVKNTLKKDIDTVGTERSITAPNGRTAKVVGVNYGWKIDAEKEKAQIVKDLKAMKSVEREPVYDYRAESHEAADWGKTYVEVSIPDQKAWIIKDGAVVLETDVVTGNPNIGHDTDKGIFIIQNKLKNTVLRGPKKNGKYEWESPVQYWMQFTRNGQGFHDASWQGAFGGQRYREGFGSHGCVNLPTDVAAKFYELTYNSMPVIIHD